MEMNNGMLNVGRRTHLISLGTRRQERSAYSYERSDPRAHTGQWRWKRTLHLFFAGSYINNGEEFILRVDTPELQAESQLKKQKKQTERNKPQSITGMMGRGSRKQRLVISMKPQKSSLNLALIALGVAKGVGHVVWLAEFCQTAKRHGRMAGKLALSERMALKQAMTMNMTKNTPSNAWSWREIKHRFDGEPPAGAIEQDRTVVQQRLEGAGQLPSDGRESTWSLQYLAERLIYPRMIIQHRMEGSKTFGTGSDAGMMMGEGKRSEDTQACLLSGP
ncbi:hypothetical protein B0H19DRAFT_1067407 [Mycena capillaripes]|nr:hypothetical protein B0H19DRAFT_1067407 [Mycena capillaripes]